jgi:hypothetical protein
MISAKFHKFTVCLEVKYRNIFKESASGFSSIFDLSKGQNPYTTCWMKGVKAAPGWFFFTCVDTELLRCLDFAMLKTIEHLLKLISKYLEGLTKIRKYSRKSFTL